MPKTIESEQYKCFAPTDWTVVLALDHCDWSKQQFKMLQNKKAKDSVIMDVIDCSDTQNQSIPICKEVKGFPAWCNTKTNTCMYGLKNTDDELEQICEITKRDAQHRKDETAKNSLS